MELIGAIFIITLGCLGHFIFEWSGHKHFAGILFAVNESTWEHIKLAIFPSFLWMIAEIVVRGFSPTLIIAQFASMMTMILLIPGLFYGYTAITKKNYLISDIACFLLAVIIGELVFSAVFLTGYDNQVIVIISLAGLALILFAFLRFSYYAPHNFLFKDPVSGGFGPTGHECESDFHTHNSHKHHHHI